MQPNIGKAEVVFMRKILSTEKVGQIHFTWGGDIQLLRAKFEDLKEKMLSKAESLTANMNSRGGGITGIELVDLSAKSSETYQLRINFKTADSMGANFINSVLELFSKVLVEFVSCDPFFGPERHNLDVHYGHFIKLYSRVHRQGMGRMSCRQLGTIESFDAS